MSVSTPILTFICWALAVPQAKVTARAVRPIILFIDISSLLSGRFSSLDTKIVVKLVDICIQFGVRELIDDPSMFHHVVPVRNGRGEAEILFHQQNGKALFLKRADGLADLLDNNRSEALGRFVQQQ